MNKILVKVIYKSCAVEEEDWEEKLPSTLWAYRTYIYSNYGTHFVSVDVWARGRGTDRIHVTEFKDHDLEQTWRYGKSEREVVQFK